MKFLQSPRGHMNRVTFTVITILFICFGSLISLHVYQNLQFHSQIAELQKTVAELQSKQKEEKASAYIEESQIVETVKKVQDSVVSIVASKDLPKYRGRSFGFDPFFSNDPFFQQFFNVPQQNQNEGNNEDSTEKVKIGGGSGFIYSEDGLIITNKHVVSDAEADYTVVLFDGTELQSEVLARDDFNDVAILKLKADEGKSLPKLHPVKLGNSSHLQVGQRVVAIGNALAEFQNTVTTGIISAKGREITASDGSSQGEALENLLQTDAAINPGNSGGPLVNLNGEVVGMNTAIAENANGIGFALPVDDLKHFAEIIKKNGKYIRPFLGVRYMMLNEELAKQLNIKQSEGALLYSDVQQGIPAVVKDSPADKAGLKMSDIVLSIDGKKLTQDDDLRSVVANKSIGDTLKLEVLRDGKKFEVSVKLEELKNDEK